MNKQEVINKLQSSLYPETSISSWDEGYNTGITQAIHTVTELDELDKEVVPQFVADFYESIKDDFEYKVYELCLQYKHRGDELPQGVAWWFGDSRNKPIQTLVNMHQFGYEVEKEKLYLASFRDTGQYLGWNEELGEWFMSCSPFTSGVEQTRETWEGVGIWDNPAFEIKEV